LHKVGLLGYKVGILTFSDGRPHAHNAQEKTVKREHEKLANALKKTGEAEVIEGSRFITSHKIAVEEAKRMVREDVDCTILNTPIWVFPHFVVIAARNGQQPYLLFANDDPSTSAMVGMLASSGSLDQLGIRYKRVWGDAANEKTLGEMMVFIRAAYGVKKLKGQTYGLFGGRSMGMYTAISELATWQRKFGVDIEHVDQLEIIREAEKVSEEDANRHLKWLKENVSEIVYDGKFVTDEMLKKELKCYIATKRLAKKLDFDFIGVKCQPELSDGYCTQCFTSAFMNDPYDADGKKEPMVMACEVDMDGALTMQILKLLSKKPVLFFDFRGYDEEIKAYVFANCGAMSTWYSARSNDPRENLKKVRIEPAPCQYFLAGGANIQFICKEGDVTCARLLRRNGEYLMMIMRGKFVEMPLEKLRQTTWQWPHAFVKINVEPENLIKKYGSNHVHAVTGDYVNELIEVCNLLDIKYEVFG